MKSKLPALIVIAIVVLVMAACGDDGADNSAQQQSQNQSDQLQTQIYQSKNQVEFKNYNDRQRVADDASTILWCTFFPMTPAQEPITVPIAGKLTSSNKRPYSSIRYADRGSYTFTQQEVPGPDHMFGSSSEYRYGFDPTRTVYYDFTDLPSFCTTAPLVWQRNKTTIVVDTDATLGSLDKAAQAALKSGDAKQAQTILKKAESNAK